MKTKFFKQSVHKIIDYYEKILLSNNILLVFLEKLFFKAFFHFCVENLEQQIFEMY